MHVGFSPELDKSEGIRVPAGSFVTVPADHMHNVVRGRDGAAAPIKVNYVDPRPHPRN